MSPLSARGGVCVVAGIHVDLCLIGLRQAWSVAAVVRRITSFAGGGDLRSGRPCVLPDQCVFDSASPWIGTFEDAAGGRRTLVVEDPLLRLRKATRYVSCRGDSALAVWYFNARAIDAGAESRLGYACKPRTEVCRLFRQQSAALFLIEKDDGMWRKAFAPCRLDCSLRICCSQRRGVFSF